MSTTFWNFGPRGLAAQLAPMNGQRLNTSLIAQLIGVSRPTALSRVLGLQRLGLVRLLPFFGGHGRPLLFLCDSYGAGPASFRAFCLEAVCRTLLNIDPRFRFFWWKTGRVRRIDLLATNGERRIGFCFDASQLCRRKDLLPLVIGLDRGLIHRGFLLHCGSHAFVLGKAIRALPLQEFLREPVEWIFARQSWLEALEALRRINERVCAKR